MSLQQDVITLLRSTEVGQVQFRYGRSFIIGTEYDQLADDISNRRVGVVTDVQPARAAASYQHLPTHAHPNSLVFPRGWNRIGNDIWRQLCVVHEATHAIQDTRAAEMSQVEAEGVAFIAEALYLRITGRTHSVYDRIQQDARYDTARVICRRAWHAAVELWERKLNAVPSWRVEHINRAIAADPNYSRTRRYRFDGIPAAAAPVPAAA